jgi:O-antigen ligase
LGRGVVVLSISMMTFVLILTQSRLGMASLIVASGVSGLLAFPRMRRVVLGVFVVSLVFVLIIGPERLVTIFVDSVAGRGFVSWDSRLALWRMTLQVLIDFPFTGIGLAVFYPVSTYLYTFGFSPLWMFGHAHETYLQMGVDFGLAGLISFAMMIWIAIRQGWPDRDTGRELWILRLGVWTSVLTYALFGIFDGLPLWTKPGFVVWALLGLVVIGRRLAVTSVNADRRFTAQQPRRVLVGVGDGA